MYLDTAILVKLLVREADSDWFNIALIGQAVESSELVLTEVRSALFAKSRAGQITVSFRNQAEDRFLEMVNSETLVLHPLNRRVLERASAILRACHPHIPLRTMDALHVATCDLHHGEVMAATDGRVRAACEQLAISLLPRKMEELTANH